MKKLFVVFLFFAMFFFAPLVEANGWLSGYYNRIKIPIDATKVDAALSNFPVLVKLTSANFDFSKANSDGYDFRFTSDDGTTLLKYERERHDSANSLAEYWIKVPSVSASADTYIYLYYRTEDTADGADPENVWDSNFKAVHHLKDNTTSAVLDSTSNNNDGTKKGANEPAQADGKIYKAQDFDGTDDKISISSDDFEVGAGDPITVEVWFNDDNADKSARCLFCLRENATGVGAINIWTYKDGNNNPSMGSQLRDNDGNMVYSVDANGWGGPIAKETWYHVALLRDASGNVYGYLNGAEISLGSGVNGAITYNQSLFLGVHIYESYPSGTQFFDGKLDEVRISTARRSAAWIKASYHAGAGSLLKSFVNESLYGNFFLMF